MMQSVPAHIYASRDALHYLVITYLWQSGKTILPTWETYKGNNYSPSVFVQLSLHHAFGFESWGLSDFVFSKVNLGDILLRMLLPISKRMAFDAGVRYFFFI